MTTIDITKIEEKTVELPSFPGAEVTLKASLTVKEIEDIKKQFDPKDKDFDEKVGEQIIIKNIVSWNLAAGEDDLPIEIASLKLLPLRDFQFLVQEITGEKKLDENGNILTAAEQDAEAKKK